MLSFSSIKTNDSLGIKLKGDLDIDSTEVIELDLMTVISGYNSISINLEEVPFIDSSGIGLLLNMVQTLKGQRVKVTICHVREEVMDIFELLQIPEILGEDVFL